MRLSSRISSKLRPVLPIPSSIIVSLIQVDKWHQVIGDPTLADAICDPGIISCTALTVSSSRAAVRAGKKRDPG